MQKQRKKKYSCIIVYSYFESMSLSALSVIEEKEIIFDKIITIFFTAIEHFLDSLVLVVFVCWFFL